ncbi:MAG: His-Xaa-Ser repeat protein HxsA [gamma proteobacterium symbiont of Clathrolucina costata]
MKAHFKKLAALISLSLGHNSNAAVEVDAPSVPLTPDNLKLTDLNIGVSQLLAGHRSHSSHGSHRSHRSSSGGGYSSPSPSKTPSYTPTPKPKRSEGSNADPLGQKARPKSSYPSTSSSTAQRLKDKEARKNIIMRMQLALQFEGYYSGPVDGIMGPETRKAVAKYKMAKGISGTGVMDAETLNSLGIKGF